MMSLKSDGNSRRTREALNRASETAKKPVALSAHQWPTSDLSIDRQAFELARLQLGSKVSHSKLLERAQEIKDELKEAK